MIVDEDIIDYAEAHTSPEDDVLYRLNRWSHLSMPQPRMIAGAYQGELLTLFSRMIAPKHIVEIGSYVGYSTICLARGLTKDGILDAIEINDELEDIILRNVSEANLSNRVKLHIGDAKEIIPTIQGNIDLAFIDADKRQLWDYYEMMLPRVKPGGWILIDNVLWDGKVTNSETTDADTNIFRQLNDRIHQDPRTENLLLPVRDGLLIIQKRP